MDGDQLSRMFGKESPAGGDWLHVEIYPIDESSTGQTSTNRLMAFFDDALLSADPQPNLGARPGRSLVSAPMPNADPAVIVNQAPVKEMRQ